MDATTEAVIQAVRAQERAEAAHERLDRMNGSIDKLALQVTLVNTKIDASTMEILRRLDRQDGLHEGTEIAEQRRNQHITLVVAAAAAAGVVASAVTYGTVILFHL